MGALYLDEFLGGVVEAENSVRFLVRYLAVDMWGRGLVGPVWLAQ